MFWQKKNGPTSTQTKDLKLTGPKEIPEPIARHLVIQMKRDPDNTWGLKSVVRPRPDSKDAFDFRIFDNAQIPAKVHIENYNSLDSHPDLVLYQGWYDKKSFDVHIDK